VGDYLNRTGLIAKVSLATVEALAGDQTQSENQMRVDQAIADAEGEINGYLAARYQTPLSPAPAILVTLTVRVALWNLLSAKGYDPNSEDRAVKENYDGAIKFLQGVAAGNNSLGVTDAQGESEPESQIEAVHPDPALPSGWRERYP